MTSGDLERFVTAQDSCLPQVEAELKAGRKQTHWMWFVFPQLAGLGRSGTAKFYAIEDLREAQRYLAHPVLGARLRRHVGLLLQHAGKTAHEILGSPDDLKLHSCLTLFEAAAATPEDRELFHQGLKRFYSGQPDRHTLDLLETR